MIHVAGLAHIFGKSQAAAAPFHDVNALGTANVARAAAESGVRALVLVSSVSVYGPHEEQLVDETFPCRPDGPYAESKHWAEQLATEIAAAAGMRLTILRTGHACTGRATPATSPSCSAQSTGKVSFGSATAPTMKSLIHRDDAARACIAAAVRPVPRDSNVQRRRAACTMRQIVETIAAALSRKFPAWHIPAGIALNASRVAGALPLGHGRLGDLQGTLRKWLSDDAYSARRFETDFDFRTEVALAEGIRREAFSYRAGFAGRGVKTTSTPPLSIDKKRRVVVMLHAIVLLLIATTASYFGVAGLRRWALHHLPLDIPNQRSSHFRPTPRGGGLAIVLVTALGWIALRSLLPAEHVLDRAVDILPAPSGADRRGQLARRPVLALRQDAIGGPRPWPPWPPSCRWDTGNRFRSCRARA